MAFFQIKQQNNIINQVCCLECNCKLDEKVNKYSIDKYKIPLCREHQEWVTKLLEQSTETTIRLYFALKEQGIKAEIEKWDGFKHIDLAIPKAKINIEVDGQHHNYNKNQAIADLKRTYYSFEKGFFTLRIPNSLLKEDNKTFEDAVVYIKKFIEFNLNKR